MQIWEWELRLSKAIFSGADSAGIFVLEREYLYIPPQDWAAPIQFNSTLHLRTLRPGEGQALAQSLLASQEQTWDCHPLHRPWLRPGQGGCGGRTVATVDLSVLFLFLGTAQTHLDLFKRSSQPGGGWGRGVLKASCHGDYVFPFCERYMDGQGPAPAFPLFLHSPGRQVLK